jgi:hypothetical protein
MHAAYAYDARKIWIVNVGDLKPMEFPISFFLDYAWDVNKWNAADLPAYYTRWAAEQFGAAHAKEIGEIIQKYTQYNARSKPELLDANTYSLLDYDESDRVKNDYDRLAVEAERVGATLPAAYQEAYFELVLHPVKACANLQDLYTAVAWNHYYAGRNDPRANNYADTARRCYVKDSLISMEYNHLNKGEWDHMMDQTHIGYRYWQEPRHQAMPEVSYVTGGSRVSGPSVARDRGVAGDRDTMAGRSAVSMIPKGRRGNVFYEKDGYVSIEAAHFTEKMNRDGIQWKVIPGIGRDGDGITSFPVTAADNPLTPDRGSLVNAPFLTYEFYTYDTGQVKLSAYFSPTLNFRHDTSGLRYGISLDDEAPQIVSIDKNDANMKTWGEWVASDVIIKTTAHRLGKAGKHTVRFWRVSPAVVLQKIVLDLGGEKPSYLGPPETLQNK